MDEIYLKQVRALLDDNVIGSIANVASFLYETLHDVNWVGYYFHRDDKLILGPFMGKIACSKLALDKGVCAKAFRDKSVTYVRDVHNFDGHIACDADSRSELVLPLYNKEKVIGVLDIDAPITDRFNQDDIDMLSEVAMIISAYLSGYDQAAS